MGGQVTQVRIRSWSLIRRLVGVGLVIGLCAALTLGALGILQNERGDRGDIEAGVLTLPRYETIVNRPSPPVGASAGVDVLGREITISCVVCHSNRTPNRANASGEDLDEFHQGLSISHGGLSCLSCHNPDDYGSLHLSGGARVEFSSVQTLCAQCHSKTVESYEHGAHGGMTGYWDLTRGGRIRNGCLDCHDPHAPAFPQMMPTFKPIDRFLEGSHG